MKKNAGTFRIEPDGFSIHTFELSKKVTNNDYKRMRDRLYCQRPKGEIGSLPAFWHVPSAGRTLLGLHYCSVAMICSQYAFS